VVAVSLRTGLAPGKNVLEVEQQLLARVPQEFLVDAHHWLILHGRYVCQARRPLCERCAVVAQCDSAPMAGAR
jgi:endonuclease-3